MRRVTPTELTACLFFFKPCSAVPSRRQYYKRVTEWLDTSVMVEARMLESLGRQTSRSVVLTLADLRLSNPGRVLQRCKPAVARSGRRSGPIRRLGLRPKLGGVQTPGPSGGSSASSATERHASRKRSARNIRYSASAAGAVLPLASVGTRGPLQGQR